MSRTNWALVIVGGVAGAGAAIYDMATGRATFGEVCKDIAIFIEGWFAELIVPTYDAELEKTHAYALFLLILPGLLLLWFNLIPFLKRGSEFQVHTDGNTVEFTPPPEGPPAVRLPQDRVFSREYGVRLKSSVGAEFFRRVLAGRGFVIEGPATGNHFIARRR